MKNWFFCIPCYFAETIILESLVGVLFPRIDIIKSRSFALLRCQIKKNLSKCLAREGNFLACHFIVLPLLFEKFPVTRKITTTNHSAWYWKIRRKTKDLRRWRMLLGWRLRRCRWWRIFFGVWHRFASTTCLVMKFAVRTVASLQ